LNYTDQQKAVSNAISNSGMELFYEISSKTPVRKFHSTLVDYECQIQRDLEFKCKSEEFNHFLMYAICFSAELLLFLDKNYYKDVIDNEYDIQNQIDEISLKYGKFYHELALKELKKNYEYNLETINLLPPLFKYRKNNMDLPSVSYPIVFNQIRERESDLINLANSYYNFLDLKEMTENYSGIIVRLHSY